MAKHEQCLALLILESLALATRVTLPRQGHTCVPAPLWWQLSRDRWAVYLFWTLPKPAAPSPPPTVTSLSLYSFWKNTHIHLREPITWHMMLRQSWRKAASTRHHSAVKPNPTQSHVCRTSGALSTSYVITGVFAQARDPPSPTASRGASGSSLIPQMYLHLIYSLID